MTFKSIAFDLDGTLLNSEKKIDRETIDLIKELNKKKCIILISGRHISEMQDYISQLNLNQNSYYISSDGQYIYDWKLKELHRENYILKKDIISIIEKLSLSELLLVGEKKDYFIEENYIKFILKKIAFSIKKLKKEVILLKKLKKEKVNNIEKIVFLKQKNLENSEVLNKFLTHLYDNGRIEILNKKSGKYNSLKVLSQIRKLDLDKLLYFGDEINDYECFSKLKNTVAMKNASKKIKEEAKYITKSCDDRGVYYFLKNYKEREIIEK